MESKNPLRATAVGHNIHGYKLTAFVVAAAYAGFAGGLLGIMQGFMPPDAFTFETSGQLVMQTAIGGAGTLFGPLVGATVWIFLSDLLQTQLHLGATWKLVLGVIFVLLICFLRRGLIGGIDDLYQLAIGARKKTEPVGEAPTTDITAEDEQNVAAADAAHPPAIVTMPARHRDSDRTSGPILQAKGLTKRYGGLVANSDIDFVVDHGELRGIIGPNGVGKSTFFKMLTCEVPPTAGQILFEGRDITGATVTDVCQLGLTKSYQINQLFNRLTVRENITIAALATLRGKFRDPPGASRTGPWREPWNLPGCRLGLQLEWSIAMPDPDQEHTERREALTGEYTAVGGTSASSPKSVSSSSTCCRWPPWRLLPSSPTPARREASLSRCSGWRPQ